MPALDSHLTVNVKWAEKLNWSHRATTRSASVDKTNDLPTERIGRTNENDIIKWNTKTDARTRKRMPPTLMLLEEIRTANGIKMTANPEDGIIDCGAGYRSPY
jgi:hypothetical protein